MNTLKGVFTYYINATSKLKAILEQVKIVLGRTNKDYALVLTRLYLYYDMKLVTFGIDSQRNLIIQFPVFMQPYTQRRLILYQTETVPVPVLDTNYQAQSYTQLKIDKPYTALDGETYISLHPQELNTGKRIGYEYFCEELFVVKSKNRYSCVSTIYFNLGSEIIKESCEYNFYFNKTDVKPAVLDGGYQIILVNWCSYKRIICTHNNNIPIDIPSHPYVLLNRSILCNCDIEAESNFLLKLLTACGEKEKPDLEMYFTVNLAFVDYLDQLKETMDTPVIRNWTNQEQILSIALKSFEINSSILQAPKMLKEYVNPYRKKRKLLDLQEKTSKEKQNEQNSKYRTFITSFITDTLVFSAALLTVIVTLVVIYMISGQSKLKTLVANIALQCIRVIEVFNPKYQDVHCDFSILKYIMILILVVVIILAFGKLRKSRIFRGWLFSNIVKIKLFIADAQSYVPIELSKIPGNVHLFK